MNNGNHRKENGKVNEKTKNLHKKCLIMSIAEQF